MTYQTVDILLVEDSEDDAEMTMHALQQHHLGNHMVWLKDGVEAMDFLHCQGAYADRNSGNPKIVMPDIKMPRMDGIEVLRKIRADQTLGTIPVVMLTASVEERDVLASYQLGVNSYVAKPVDFNSFVEDVSKTGCYWLLINQAPNQI